MDEKACEASKPGSYRPRFYSNRDSGYSTNSSTSKPKQNVYEQVAPVIRRSDFDNRNIFGGQKNRPLSWHPPNKKERRLAKQYIVDESLQDKVHLKRADSQQVSRSVKSYVIDESPQSEVTDESYYNSATKRDTVCENMKSNTAHRSASYLSTKDCEYNAEGMHSANRFTVEDFCNNSTKCNNQMRPSLHNSGEQEISDSNSQVDSNIINQFGDYSYPSSRKSLSASSGNLPEATGKSSFARGFFNSLDTMKRTSLMSSFKRSHRNDDEKDKTNSKTEENATSRRQNSILKDGIFSSMRNLFTGRTYSNKSDEANQKKSKEKSGNQKVFVVSNDSVDIQLKMKDNCSRKSTSLEIVDEESPKLVSESLSAGNASSNNNNFLHNTTEVSLNSEQIPFRKKDLIVESHKQKMKELKEKFLNDQTSNPSLPETDTLQSSNTKRLSDSSSRSSIDSLNSKLYIPSPSIPNEIPSLSNNNVSSRMVRNSTSVLTATQSESVNEPHSKCTTELRAENATFEKNEKFRMVPSHLQARASKPINQFKRMSLPSPIIEGQEYFLDSANELNIGNTNDNHDITNFKVPLSVDKRKFDRLNSDTNKVNNTSSDHADFDMELSEMEMLFGSSRQVGLPGQQTNSHYKSGQYDSTMTTINWSEIVQFSYVKFYTVLQTNPDQEIIHIINNLDDELFDIYVIPVQRKIFDYIADVMEIDNPNSANKMDPSRRHISTLSKSRVDRQDLVNSISKKVDLLSQQRNEVEILHQTSQEELKKIRDELVIKCSSSWSIKFDRFISNVNTIIKLMCNLSRRLSNLDVLYQRNKEDNHEYMLKKTTLYEQLKDAQKLFANIKNNISKILSIIANCTGEHYVKFIKEKIETALKHAIHLEIIVADLKDYTEIKERLILLNEYK